MRPLLNGLLLLLLAGVLTSCEGSPVSATSTVLSSCNANQAIIQILDGESERVCGCAEASPTTVPSGTALVCTVSTQTYVTFLFGGSLLHHQIVPVGTPAIPVVGVPSDPKQPSTQAAEEPPQAAGTYRYEDQFNNQVYGEIIYQ